MEQFQNTRSFFTYDSQLLPLAQLHTAALIQTHLNQLHPSISFGILRQMDVPSQLPKLPKPRPKPLEIDLELSDQPADDFQVPPGTPDLRTLLRPTPPKPFEIDLELPSPDDPPLQVKPGTPDLRTPEGWAEYDRRQAEASKKDGHQP